MENLSILKSTTLFAGLTKKEIAEIILDVPTNLCSFKSFDTIVHQGDTLDYMGVVVAGNAIAIKNGFDGEQVVQSNLSCASVFGDVLSGSMNFESPVTVKALSDCRVLFINYAKLLYSTHPSVHKVLQNMIKTISLKFFAQNERIEILMLKSVRYKIQVFLEQEKARHQNNCFAISLNRKQMADYLGIERTALCRELSRMAKLGLISYSKNNFCVF